MTFLTIAYAGFVVAILIAVGFGHAVGYARGFARGRELREVVNAPIPTESHEAPIEPPEAGKPTMNLLDSDHSWLRYYPCGCGQVGCGASHVAHSHTEFKAASRKLDEEVGP